MTTFYCPICRGPGPGSPRYPAALCDACMDRAVDVHGNRVSFGNEGLSGGLVSSSPECMDDDYRGRCHVDGFECVVEEGRFGGVVMQPASELLRLSEAQLLARHSAVLTELKRRNVVRSHNNPTGDYAEWLVASRLGLTLATNSTSGYDALDADGLRYQIKARRITQDNPSTQLGVIRNLDGNDFDLLVAVVFDADWNVLRAALIPHDAIPALARYREHVNGHVMHLRPSVMGVSGVTDLTERLAAA